MQHSGMARRGFKQRLTRLVPEPAERSTYVLVSSVALILLFALWRPLGGVVWDVGDPTGRLALYGLFAFGFALVLVATLLINHFDLFGLRQVWLYLRGAPYTPLRFRDAQVVPARAAPALRRLVLRLLGHPDDDRHPPRVRRRHHRLHPGRDPARGARPGGGVRVRLHRYKRQVPMLVPRFFGWRAPKAEPPAVEAA